MTSRGRLGRTLLSFAVVAGPSALAGQEGNATPSDRGGRRLPTNAYGLPVVDEQGGRINYSREELAGLALPERPRFSGGRAEGAPNFSANATWAYAAFGSGVGLSNLVVASNGSKREIYLGGTVSTFGINDYWHALSYRGPARGYEQTFVSPYLPTNGFDGIARIEVGQVDPSPGSEILVARPVGLIEVYALTTKAWLRQIVTASTDLRGMQVVNVDGDPANEIVVCDPGAIRVYSDSGVLEWQVMGAGGEDLVVAQMDNDPALEIAVTDGSVVDAATRQVQWKRAGFGANVEAADIDGDGRQELIAAESWYIVWAYDVDLQLPKWSIPAELDIDAIHLTDIDADGTIELLMGDGQWGGIHAFNTVTLAEEWQIPNPEHGVTDITTGDVDGDGTVELLWGAGQSSTGADHLYVVNWSTGQTEWSNVHLDGPFLGPERADLDGDGKLELVAASFSAESGYDSGRILVFDDASRRLRAISPPIVGNLSWTGTHDLRLRDVDGDGRFEILVAADRLYDGVIEIYDFTAANAFNLAWTNATQPDGASFRSVEAADIDGDGVLEIVAGAGREHTGAEGVFVYAYSYATRAEEWHSLQLGGYWDAVGGLRISDTDADGTKDIVAMVEGGDLYFFDGPSKALEALLTTQGEALQVYGSGAAAKITVADAAGDLSIYRYQQGSYQETYRQHFVPGPIDGFDRVQGNQYWVGHDGSLRLVSAAGATLWQSASYGTIFGARTIQPNAKRFLAAGTYAIVAFSSVSGIED